MKLTELLKGKTVNIITDAKVIVQLEIETVTENISIRTHIIEPDSPKNDWWGTSIDYRDISYDVKFTNGFSKTYKSLESIDLVISK